MALKFEGLKTKRHFHTILNFALFSKVQKNENKYRMKICYFTVQCGFDDKLKKNKERNICVRKLKVSLPWLHPHGFPEPQCLHWVTRLNVPCTTKHVRAYMCKYARTHQHFLSLRFACDKTALATRHHCLSFLLGRGQSSGSDAVDGRLRRGRSRLRRFLVMVDGAFKTTAQGDVKLVW